MGRELKPYWVALALAVLLIFASILREYPVAFQINGATAYFAELLQTITGWALAAVIIAALLLSTASVRRLIRRIRSFSFQGVSFTLDEDSRRELEEQFDEVAGTLKAYRDKVSAGIRREVNNRMLQQKLEFVGEELKKVFPCADYPEGFRCTVHMQDLVFKGRLYQLLDYFTKDGETDGAGRSLPLGYGIIGRVWRSRLNDLQGKLFSQRVTTGPDGNPLDVVQRIMLEWGMNRADAVKAKAHPSYLCCLIRHEEVPVGIFYADAKVEDAFAKAERSAAETKAVFDAVASAMEAVNFARALHEMRAELAKVSPGIEIEV